MAFTIDNLETTSRGLTVNVLFKTMEAKEFIKRVRDAVRPIMAESAQRIAMDASKRAPVSKNEGGPRVLSEALTGKEFKKGVGFKVRTNTKQGVGRTGYGADIEFGDSRIKARPFLYPAYDEEVGHIMDHLRDVL